MAYSLKGLRFFIITWIMTWCKCSREHWSYTNSASSPLRWVKYNPSCGGPLQSPIDIRGTQYDPKLLPIRLFVREGFNPRNTKYQVKNNGHSVQITFPQGTWFVSFLNDFTKQYEVAQLHFHWGSNNQRGTEHSIRGKKYSLEGHLVCFNKMFYPTLKDAVSAPNGLAVLGFLNKVRNLKKSVSTLIGSLGKFEQTLSSLVTEGSEASIPYFNLTKLLDLVDPRKYYRYQGSLTTVPCTQNVMWTIFQRVIPATAEELNNLRKLKFTESEKQTQMSNNFRPVQPLNPPRSLLRRTVYRS